MKAGAEQDDEKRPPGSVGFIMTFRPWASEKTPTSFGFASGEDKRRQVLVRCELVHGADEVAVEALQDRHPGRPGYLRKGGEDLARARGGGRKLRRAPRSCLSARRYSGADRDRTDDL